MPNKREVRKMLFEVRAEENKMNHKASLVGLPIVYGQVIQYGWRREVIDPGAVDENTDLTDVPFLIGHVTSMVPLARSLMSMIRILLPSYHAHPIFSALKVSLR